MNFKSTLTAEEKMEHESRRHQGFKEFIGDLKEILKAAKEDEEAQARLAQELKDAKSEEEEKKKQKVMVAPKILKRITSSKNGFQCQNCAKSFAHKSSLNRHNTTEHMKLSKFQCTVCLKTFPPGRGKRFEKHRGVCERKQAH